MYGCRQIRKLQHTPLAFFFIKAQLKTMAQSEAPPSIHFFKISFAPSVRSKENRENGSMV
ncbi:hypothetical protein MtrunA17_Chr8g0346771 [Medicago truncatula]|uniref:Uncharacterized protein n=1 Tax=Medicago truncatula TaxID=3880 RepID=A0A396GLS3_MEDTR|nr:hypothetical protein MtrunA17_Chr8g0346771 [Medicago truncatula]